MAGGGRAPCCDKSKVKKGPWSPAEDLRLITFIQNHGHGNWRSLPKQAGLLRCGKSCRLRWINYLRPDVKRGNFTPQEEDSILKLHALLGNKWSKIASHLPGRTDNEIKNIWNTHLKKRSLLTNNNQNEKMSDTVHEAIAVSSPSSSSSSSNVSNGDDQNKDDQGRPGHQDGQDSLKTKGRKEASSPTSSICSYASRQSQDTGSLHNKFDSTGLGEVHNGPMEDEVVLEIPLESDVEFWDMLDNLDCLQSSSTTDQAQSMVPNQLTDESTTSEASHFQTSISTCSIGKEEGIEVEYGKWLRFFENELGLVETQSPIAAESLSKDAAGDQADDDVGDFPLWPSSPQNFGI